MLSKKKICVDIYLKTYFMGQNADPQWLEEARTRDHKTLR